MTPLRRRLKKTLAGRIRGGVLLLIFAGLIGLISGCMLINNYRERFLRSEYNGMQRYMSQLNESFVLINTNLRGMLANSAEIENLQSAFEALDYADVTTVVEQNSAIGDLMELFQNMGDIYGGKYSFFYYDYEFDKMVEYGDVDYAVRRPFLQLISDRIADGTLEFTLSGRWFLYGDCICTIFRGNDCLIGAYTQLNDFMQIMFDLSPTPYTQIEVYDQRNNVDYLYAQSENGSIHREELSLGNSRSQDYYSLSNASFQCRFITGWTSFEKALVFPLIFILVVILYLCVVFFVLHYIRRDILDHVNDFYNNILKYKDTASFDENGIVEFAEAGKVLNQMAEEIRSLKIDIYEEQIRKQRIELDYAHMQIRPHFYINCLNIIHSMAQLGRMKEIQNITVLVSNYLRNILKSGMIPVPIKSELEFVDNYIRMLECMNAAHYTCRVHMQEDLRDFSVPPLLIQTFVENSLKYNLDRDEFKQDIYIINQKKNDDNYCCIRIEDNGHGFAPEILKDFNNGHYQDDISGHHIGIRNAVARLQLLYGESAGISLSNKSNGGAVVSITIPLE